MTVMEANQIRIHYYNNTNPTEEDRFLYTEALEFLIRETKGDNYMVELGAYYYEQRRLQELWQRTQTAYAHNDVKELSEIEVLVRKLLREMGAGEIRIEIPEIDQKIEELKKEIREITQTEPYTYKSLMEDPEAIRKKKDTLTEELETYRKYCAELDGVIEDMLKNGGVTIRWQMN